jgi:hypothetical protein
MRNTYLHRLSRPYRAAAATGAGAFALDPEPEPDDFAGPSVPPTGYRRPNSATARRRRAADACEVCGRTLLAGERAREIIVGERPVQACALCVIGAQRAARARAA